MKAHLNLRRIGIGLFGVLLLGAVIGCQAGGLRFLNLIGLAKQPLAVAIVTPNQLTPADTAIASLNPFSVYEQMQKSLEKDLDRPIAIELCYAFQVPIGLNSGLYDFASVSATDYLRLAERANYPVVVARQDAKQRLAQRAVLVVASSSKITKPEELRGAIVAFGPVDDPVTHFAALELLKSAGLAPGDLSLEVLPLPGSLKHVPDGRSVAQSVINGSSAAGFILESDFDELPEQSAAANDPVRGKLRVIGTTAAYPTRLLIASPKEPAATVTGMRAALLNMHKAHPEALKPLRVASYGVPDAATMAALEKLAPLVGSAPVRPAPASGDEPVVEMEVEPVAPGSGK